jgi:hypothetical protein
VFSAKMARDLSVTRSGGRSKLTLPALGEYDVVVLE